MKCEKCLLKRMKPVYKKRLDALKVCNQIEWDRVVTALENNDDINMLPLVIIDIMALRLFNRYDLNGIWDVFTEY